MAEFLNDTFTDTDTTSLEDHTGETGATWTLHPADGAADVFKIDENMVFHNTSGDNVIYASGDPADADYDVEGVVVVEDVNASAGIAICGRMDTTNKTFYMLQYFAGGIDTWQMFKCVNGSFTQLGSDYDDVIGTGNSRTCKLEMRGTTIKGYVDGVERISATDSDISAAGKAGIRGNGPSAVNDGPHLDSMTATDAGGGTTSLPPIIRARRSPLLRM